MRIALLHNPSDLGVAVARRLLEHRLDELLLISPAQAPTDPTLAHLEASTSVARVLVSGVRDDGFASALRTFEPDVLLVVTFPWRLPRRLRALARVAALNLHPSLLPRWRGPAPEFWALRAGDRTTGLTLHVMDDELDTGPIIARTEIAIGDHDTSWTLGERLATLAPDFVQGALAAYRRGPAPAPTAQDDRLATVAPAVRDADLAIDWREPAHAITRLVRAAFPLFEAHAWFAGERLRITAARPTTSARALAPGEIALDAAQRRVLVGTGDGALELLMLGTRDAHAMARERAWTDGASFDPPPFRDLRPAR